MKKTVIAAALIACMLFMLCACGNESDESNNKEMLDGTWYSVCENPEGSDENITFNPDGTFTSDLNGVYGFTDETGYLNICFDGGNYIDYEIIEDEDGNKDIYLAGADYPTWCATPEGALAAYNKYISENGEFGTDFAMTLDEAKEVGGLFIMTEDGFYPFQTAEINSAEVPLSRSHTSDSKLDSISFDDYIFENSFEEINQPSIFIIDENGDDSSPSRYTKVPTLKDGAKLVEVSDLNPNGVTCTLLNGEDCYVADGVISYDKDEDAFYYGTFDFFYSAGSDYYLIEQINGKDPKELIDMDTINGWYDTFDEILGRTQYGIMEDNDLKKYYDRIKSEKKDSFLKDDNLVYYQFVRPNFLYRFDDDTDKLVIKCRESKDDVDFITYEVNPRQYHAYNIPKSVYNNKDKDYNIGYTETDDGYFIVNTDELPEGLYRFPGDDTYEGVLLRIE